MAEPERARIERELREAITSGLYKPGVRLPSTADLAGQFGVSHSTVAAALANLKAARVIYGRQGLGHYVGTEDREPSIEERVAELERWLAEHDPAPGR